jgi:selenocysteine lyase/cysteine desulfurase
MKTGDHEASCAQERSIGARVINPLARHYSRFRVSERRLLTGHSHQAWPDVGFEAQSRAWLDAAELLDEKWERAATQANLVRAGFARLLGDRPANIALGQNTHELVVRWLSALPFRQRSRLVTTDGEFHTLRRQLDRLSEEGVEVTKVTTHPADTLADRVAGAVDDRTLAVLMSSVLFETAAIVPGLDRVAAACAKHGVQLLIDAYHHLNVVPFDLSSMGLGDAFITGGGYKYCQLGEGNCFLRVPEGCRLRPILTGWFAEFDALEDTGRMKGAATFERVTFGNGAAAFAGATYDPTSHYRAAAVFDFHQQQGLAPGELRRLSQRQVGLLLSAFEALDISSAIARAEPMEPEQRGGFLAIRAPRARDFARSLRERGVLVDARGDVLRLGPAPYVRDDQLSDAVAALGEVIREQT